MNDPIMADEDFTDRIERAAQWLYRDSIGWLETDNWHGIHDEARAVFRRRVTTVYSFMVAPKVPE